MKKLFLFLTILLLLFSLSGCLKKKQDTGTAEEEGTASQQEDSYSGTLKKMMSLGIPLKCSWKKDDSYYGTSWVKGDRSASEFTMDAKTANVIFKDNCMWSWQQDNPQGFQMCFEAAEVEGSMPETEEGQAFKQASPPEDIDYSCRPAVFGEEKFNPPANIEFLTTEDMMQGAVEDQGGE